MPEKTVEERVQDLENKVAQLGGFAQGDKKRMDTLTEAISAIHNALQQAGIQVPKREPEV